MTTPLRIITLSVATLLLALMALVMVVPQATATADSSADVIWAAAPGEFDPMDEFVLEAWGPEFLNFGVVDLRINRAVFHLWLAAALCIGFAVIVARNMRLKPDGKQTFTETIYEFVYEQLARDTLGTKVFKRYLPYVASLFLFIWVLNIISFIPLPVGHMTNVSAFGAEFTMPAFVLYAATSNINVTLALALVTFILTHFEGVRNNGPWGYLRSWAPKGNPFLAVYIGVLHAVSEMVRLLSLSVRLAANLFAGHMLIAVILGLSILLGTGEASWAPMIGMSIFWGLIALVALLKKRTTLAGYVAVIGGAPLILQLVTAGVPILAPVFAYVTVPVASAIYLLEVGLIISIQAMIFALLSGLYIGGAAEPDH